MKALAFMPSQDPDSIAESAISSALDDQDPNVVQFAAFGVGARGLLNELPRLFALLKHGAPEVRMAAAQAIGRFPDLAKARVDDLRNVFGVETDPVVKETLEGTIRLLERPERPKR